MIIGVFRDGHPRIVLIVVGIDGMFELEFIVDTGFEGDIVLPAGYASKLGSLPHGTSKRMMADGSLYECPYIRAEVLTSTGTQSVQALIFGPNPLVGTAFFHNCHLHAELSEGGEVIIETDE